MNTNIPISAAPPCEGFSMICLDSTDTDLSPFPPDRTGPRRTGYDGVMVGPRDRDRRVLQIAAVTEVGTVRCPRGDEFLRMREQPP